jgi:hypothetical protein
MLSDIGIYLRTNQSNFRASHIQHNLGRRKHMLSDIGIYIYVQTSLILEPLIYNFPSRLSPCGIWICFKRLIITNCCVSLDSVTCHSVLEFF